MKLLKKISESTNNVEQLLQKIFESESAEIFDSGHDNDSSPTNLVEELGLIASAEDQHQPQADQSPAQPTEGWLETEWGSVQYFIDDQGRMWTGGPTPGGGERWTRHKAGDRGTNGPGMGGHRAMMGGNFVGKTLCFSTCMAMKTRRFCVFSRQNGHKNTGFSIVFRLFFVLFRGVWSGNWGTSIGAKTAKTACF